MVCTLSFGEISNIHDGLHIRLASALLILLLLLINWLLLFVSSDLPWLCIYIAHVVSTKESSDGAN